MQIVDFNWNSGFFLIIHSANSFPSFFRNFEKMAVVPVKYLFKQDLEALFDFFILDFQKS